MNVFRARLFANENDVLAIGGEPLGFIRIEHDDADSRARRGRQALTDDVSVVAFGDGLVQQLIQRRCVDAQHGFIGGDQTLIHHIDGDFQRSLRRAFAIARLQHIEPALFDRELQILHVAIVRFERLVDLHQLVEHGGHRLFERLSRLFHFEPRRFRQCARRPDAGDNVLALGVDEELAVEFVGAG